MLFFFFPSLFCFLFALYAAFYSGVRLAFFSQCSILFLGFPPSGCRRNGSNVGRAHIGCRWRWKEEKPLYLRGRDCLLTDRRRVWDVTILTLAYLSSRPGRQESRVSLRCCRLYSRRRRRSQGPGSRVKARISETVAVVLALPCRPELASLPPSLVTAIPERIPGTRAAYHRETPLSSRVKGM